MSTYRSRTAHPLPGVPERATIGAWGMGLTIALLVAALAGLATAALYLHTGQQAWPPEGITAPPMWRAVLAGLLAIVALAMTVGADRLLIAGQEAAVAPTLLVAVAAATGTVWTLAIDLQSAPFRWDEHAYASIYWILTAAAATFVGVGAVMLGAALIQRLTGVLDSRRMLELRLASIYLGFAVVAALVLLALVHLLPDPAS